LQELAVFGKCLANNGDCSTCIQERLHFVRIPVKWAPDSGDVGRRRSEATLVEFYSSQVAHMSQEKGK
jgi:hypothetical protein